MGQLDVLGSVYLPTARKHGWQKAKSGVDRGRGSSSFAAVGLGQVVSAELGTAETRFVVIELLGVWRCKKARSLENNWHGQCMRDKASDVAVPAVLQLVGRAQR